MLVVLLAYLVYAGLTVYLTPSYDAPSLFTGELACIEDSVAAADDQTAMPTYRLRKKGRRGIIGR
jgi:hypothetical protein